MKQINYKTHGICSREIIIDVDGEIVKNVRFIGGCNGNTKGISNLVVGMKVDDVISRLKNIDCNGKGTSCPAQLAEALEQIK
ncbi:MAG: TIGR03905 family TSCPD domain-containing protein [Oscillospiraceae bacterium]